LALLLDPDSETDYQFSITKNLQGASVLDLVPKNKKGIITMSKWDQAFTAYTAVYTVTQKYLGTKLCPCFNICRK
jgi:hypothetical protein